MELHGFGKCQCKLLSDQQRQLTILTGISSQLQSISSLDELYERFYLDRSNGGGSIFDGSVEIMVHRRILTNDSITNSLAEPLNETAFGQGLVVRDKHLLIVDSPEKSAFAHRTNAQQFYMQPIPTFALTNLLYVDYSASYRQTWSALVDEMPRNLHLLTLDQLALKQFLVRVEHY